MTTEDNNKMLAEYESLEKLNDNEFYYKDRGENQAFILSIGQLKYHTSMDWLQPVARKVKDELDGRNMNPYHSHSFLEKEVIPLINKLKYAGASFDIDVLYPVVVKCVEFLNKQKSE